MVPPEPNRPVIASLGYFNTDEAQEKDLKSKLMKMVEAFTEEIFKPLKEIQKNANR